MMAATASLLGFGELDDDRAEITFADKLLEGWAKWARSTGVDLRPTPAGFLWRIPAVLYIGHEIVLIDDDFVLVDQCVASLIPKLKNIVVVEYQRPGTLARKYRTLHVNRFVYRQRLHAAQLTVYQLLTFHIDRWRHLVA